MAKQKNEAMWRTGTNLQIRRVRTGGPVQNLADPDLVTTLMQETRYALEYRVRLD